MLAPDAGSTQAVPAVQFDYHTEGSAQDLSLNLGVAEKLAYDKQKMIELKCVSPRLRLCFL